MIRLLFALAVVGGLAWVLPVWWRRQAHKQRSARARSGTPAPEPDHSAAPPVYTDVPSPAKTVQAASDPSTDVARELLPDTDDVDTADTPSGRATRTTAGNSQTDEAERVRVALSSGDTGMMERVLAETKDAILRHRLLTHIVAMHYRMRETSAYRSAFYAFAQQHMKEASSILDALRSTGQPRPERIDAFKMTAIAMDEDSRYEEAIAVCRAASALDLQDGTKTGFEGRISRLEKKLSARRR
jgi:hypothetical protein